ncbi:MAG: ubiquinone/menaquinone biosynthesis methyltransferase [Verrucomicrobiales bacterium]|nr:ubiquinone/menaquinone biosynthesis methyltransferase [Verrucomicrobiales bacterium]
MTEKLKIKAKDHLDSSEGKRHFNQKHFTESAPRYDIATRGLSFGQDAYWKKRLIQGLPELNSPYCVDIACGTGDVTFLLADKYPGGSIRGVDLTQEMIDISNERNQNKLVSFSCQDMSQLDVPDHSIDILTGSYAIRNAPDLDECLSEFHRAMKPGGHLAFLDFCKPSSKFAQSCQFWTLKLWGSFWGLLLHGNPEVHGYISASIKNYPANKELEQKFSDHHFEVVKSQRFFFGMTTIHFLKSLHTN